MLVAVYYILGKTDAIKSFIGEKIKNEDMHGMILWIYASIELEDGIFDKAKELFQRGRNYGAREKWVNYILKDKKSAKNLIKVLKPLGKLD